MASASKRLNERLAKYNHLYDDEELNSSSADGSVSSDMADSPAASVTLNGTADTNGEENSNENNNIIVPETLPVKKIMESVSVHVNGEQAVVDSSESSPSVNHSNAGMRLSSANCNGADAASAANGGLQITINSSSTADQTNNQHINKREAFLKGDTPSGKYEAPSTKFDPSLRERDGKAEKIEKSAPPPKAEKPDIKLDNHRPAVNRSESSKSLEGYVGFANLPNQVYRKSVKRGFEFTMMVVGESGLGKSTMINSLFLSELYNAGYPGPSLRTQKTVQINSTQVLLKESGVQLKLTVVDTPGFGDEVDNTDCWQPITAYVDTKYEEYLNAESKVSRKTILDDNRVHCCLYFISPTGHSLKPLDIEVMKRLHEKVNIIPLIAKADSLTPEECRDFKKNILNEIQKNKIKIYEFPDVDDEEENKELKRLKDRVPYAVVGSNKVMEVNGKRVRGRQYPWGLVEVDNLVHNDFIALRDMLIRTHMQDLKDVTNNVHYENYRYKKLAHVSASDGKADTSDSDPLTQMEYQKNEHKQKMKKMEAEMEQVFEMKVKEKMQKLKDSESDLAKRAELMKKSLEQQEAELNEKREAFLQEKSAWEVIHKQAEMDQVSMKGKKKGMFGH